MNNTRSVTAVCWQTRNHRRHHQALARCQDFGLRPLTSNLWIGMLQAVERRDLVQWFEQTFIKKTEKFHSFSLCKTCYEQAILGKLDKTKISYPQFEIVG